MVSSSTDKQANTQYYWKNKTKLSIMTQPRKTLYMDATLQPSRSLSNIGFIKLMFSLIVLSILTSLAFIPFGFFIVAGFLTINLIILSLVFHANSKTLSQKTFVRVSTDEVSIKHIDRNGKESNLEIPTAFARISLDSPGKENKYIKLANSRETYAIGRFLTPQERQTFVNSLKQALQSARAERYI